MTVPKYPFREQKEDFTFVSLLTRSEVITALNKVRAECNKVTAMSLFHSNLSKYSRLEEFEQIQSQTLSQVPGYPGTVGGQSGRARSGPWSQHNRIPGKLRLSQLLETRPGLFGACSGARSVTCLAKERRV